MTKHKLNKKNMVLITAVLLVVILVCFALPIAAEAETINPNIEFEKIDLLEELGSIKTFSFVTYPPISSTEPIKPTIYKVIEYCYSYYANHTANYGIYVYLYNPSQLELLEGGKNKISLGTKYVIEDNAQKVVDYDKFDLKFISKIDGGAYNNLFYKFKIVDKQIDGKTMYERVNKVCRQYDISEIELQEKGNFNANLLVGGGRFKFEGYAKGYGYDSEEESTLKCTQESLDVIELDLKHTYFRTETSSYGKGYQNQLDAVYFDVPNKYMKNYGNLTEIKAQWYEYKTSPIVVLHNDTYYNLIKGKEGVIDSKLPALATNLVYDALDGLGSGTCDWAFNFPDKNIVASKFKSNFLTYIYYCDKNDIKDWRLDGKDLQSYIYNYNKSYHTGTIDVYSSITNKNISNDLFVDFVDVGHTRGVNEKVLSLNKASDYVNMMDYSSNHSGWQKIKDYFGSYPKDQSYEKIPPIVPVKNLDLLMTNEDLSKEYLVDMTDIEEFKDFVNKSKGTVFKFNFGFSQYESNKIEHITHTAGGNVKDERGIMCQETVYLDFDIIWLKFVDGLDETIIPVAALPIDAIADITPPPFLENDWWKIILDILKWLGIVFAACLGLWLLAVLFPIIWTGLKIVFGVVALPFKAVGNLLKKGKSKATRVDKQTASPKHKRGRKYSADEAKMAKNRFKPKKE